MTVLQNLAATIKTLKETTADRDRWYQAYLAERRRREVAEAVTRVVEQRLGDEVV